MDALTFVVEMTKALAWPVAAVALSSIFRAELRSLLSKIKKGKVGLAEFEFEQAVAALKQDSSKIQGEVYVPVSPSAVQLATSDPRSAILGSWLEVQAEVDRLVTEAPLEWSRGQSGSSSQRVLHRALNGKQDYIDMYNDLRELRNQAVHDLSFAPRPESVVDYIGLSKELLNVLKSTKLGN